MDAVINSQPGQAAVEQEQEQEQDQGSRVRTWRISKPAHWRWDYLLLNSLLITLVFQDSRA